MRSERRQSLRDGRRRGRRPGFARAVAAAVGLALLVVTAAAWAAWPQDETIPPGVRIGDLDVGGRPVGEVRELLAVEARDQLARPVVVSVGDRKASLAPADLEARPQIGAAVERARTSRGPLSRLAARLRLVDPVEVPLTYRLKPARLEDAVRRLARTVDARAVPARVDVLDGAARATPAEDGRRLDRPALRRALATLPSAVDAKITTVPAVPSTAAAEEARARAQEVLDAPPVVTAGGRRLRLRTAELAAALRIRPRGKAFSVALEPKILEPRLRQAFADLARRPRDARFAVDGTRIRVVPGRLGRGIDVNGLARRLVAQPAAPQVAATFAAVRPELTTREAQAMRIRELVSEFTTPYACCPPRVTNIKRAAAILDGTIVPAGARFSLNEALGERTLERGFLSAPQISEGRLVDAVGGGVSQMATTIFNAAFFAGLELVDHTPHQFYISRYPVGREATVSWGGPELIVRNDWKAAILMRISASDTAVTVRFYSSRLGRRVTTTTGTPRGQRPARTIEVRNPSLPPGSRVVEQDGGVEGFTVEYTRKVFEGDKLRRDERFTVRYDPEDTIIEVGPTPPPPPKPAKPTPKPDTPPPPTGTTPDEPTGTTPEEPPPATTPTAPPEQEVPGGTTTTP